ncbi:MAG: phosphatase PAP2 family protein [Thermoleophilia bacterium]|nr:phosphatase PAP2 family protein [Thermoleophilia bacterium]
MPIARLLSTVFQPILTGVYLLVTVSALSAPSWRSAVAWGATTSLLAAGLPAADLARRVRARRVADFHLALREQRLRPLLIALLASALSLALVAALDGPRPLEVTLTAALVNGTVLTMTTVRWKVSFHAATAAGSLIILWWMLGSMSALLAPLVPAIGWSRVALGRHNPNQVVVGAAAGVILTGSVLLLGARL